MGLSSVDLSAYSMALPNEPHSPTSVELAMLARARQRLLEVRLSSLLDNQNEKTTIQTAQKAINSYREAIYTANRVEEKDIPNTRIGKKYYQLKKILDTLEPSA